MNATVGAEFFDVEWQPATTSDTNTNEMVAVCAMWRPHIARDLEPRGHARFFRTDSAPGILTFMFVHLPLLRPGATMSKRNCTAALNMPTSPELSGRLQSRSHFASKIGVAHPTVRFVPAHPSSPNDREGHLSELSGSTRVAPQREV